MKKLLILTDFFPPAYRAGGPIKSVFLLCRALSHYCRISLVTRNSDLGGKIFSNSEIIQLVREVNGRYDINYLSVGASFYMKIIKLLYRKYFDLIYINSFFSFKFSIFPLLVLTFFRSNSKIVIAPRGELTCGAISVKKIRKILYLYFYYFVVHSKKTLFHFTSQDEADEFSKIFPGFKSNYFIASNLVERDLDFTSPHCSENCEVLNLVYLSRISTKKNLHFFILVLKKIHIRVNFDIYGYIDDNDYWEYCAGLLCDMPENIIVNFKGAVDRVYSRKILHKYDLFILPTLNENFGHSIVESLSVGTPVLISDNTPWRSSASYAINSVPLLSNSWIEALNFFARLDSETKYSASQEALSIFDGIAADSDVLNYIEKMEIV